MCNIFMMVYSYADYNVHVDVGIAYVQADVPEWTLGWFPYYRFGFGYSWKSPQISLPIRVCAHTYVSINDVLSAAGLCITCMSLRLMLVVPVPG